MERFPALTRARLKQLAGDMKALIYKETRAVDKLLMTGPAERISYAEAQKLKYQPVKLGQRLGPQWATFWFQIETAIPAEWAGQRVDLLWDSQSEAQLWQDAKPLQGLNFPYGERQDATLVDKAAAGQKFLLHVEMACNTSYGVWLEPRSPHVEPFSLERCQIGLFDPIAWEMYFDFVVLQELEAEMSADNGPSDLPFAGQLLFELNNFANEYDLTNPTTWSKAQKILKELYKAHNPTITHHSYAIGNAHLDTAWLWPIAETYRKCLRTWTNQLAIMDVYQDYKFAFSAAFHYQIMKEQHPEIYKRVQKKAKDGQWLAVGGSWIEPDCLMPSGESLTRQFLFGQRFFQKEFGHRCREFFSPDAFGYSAQLPQIMKLVGMDYFTTPKIHENELNKPNHHTFIWQGIDASKVLAHFSPLRFCTSSLTVADMRNVLKRFREHDCSDRSMILYGYGDGGGGPTKEMIERLQRYRDLQGIPKARMESPQTFFDAIAPFKDQFPTQIGEIYFEYHRGTYTTQAWIKKANRKAEILLHDLEFLAVLATTIKKSPYPQNELDRLWKLLLLNQMHDILPGSSIALVYEDAIKDFADIEAAGEKLKQHNIAILYTDTATANSEKPKQITKAQGKSPQHAAAITTSPTAGVSAAPASYLPINTTSFPRHEVCTLPNGQLVIAQAPSYGTGEIICLDQVSSKALDKSPITPSIIEHHNQIIIENAHLRATFEKTGDLISLIEKQSGRESIAAPANRLQIFSDKPPMYDAWQLELYHLETAKDCPPAHSYSIITAPATSQSGDSSKKLSQNTATNAAAFLRAEIKFERKIAEKSSMVQTVRLDAHSRRLEFHCTADWHESHKVLKVLFPVTVRSMEATYDIQFGALTRPTHFNTSYDMAQFEVCAHKWADLSEYAFGVALLTESKYGYSVFDNDMRITLLRSSKLPDPNADMGSHEFAYVIMPHTGSWQEAGVVAEAYKFNMPLLWAPGADSAEAIAKSYLSVDDSNLVIDTIKKAEDSQAIVIRLYECHGARGTAKLKTSLPYSRAVFCNLLEDDGLPVNIIDGQLEIPYTPFQIISVKLI